MRVKEPSETTEKALHFKLQSKFRGIEMYMHMKKDCYRAF
jgi:hypothetical protein